MINNLTIGLQVYTLRDIFVADPLQAFKIAKDIGYEAVDIFVHPGLPEAATLKAQMEEAGVSVCGNNIVWQDILPENIDATLKYNEAIGNKNIAIGSAPIELLGRRTALKDIIRQINEAYKIAKDAGFNIGYHTHATDFVMVDGISAWDRILDNTPDDFCMVLDTGNAFAGGGNSIHYLNRYPGRTPWIHLKPFSTVTGSNTMIGEDSFDWDQLIDTAVNVGKSNTLIIEYSCFAHDTPENNARNCYNKLAELLNK